MFQEPEALEAGAGAGTQDVTELDAWQKCGALAAVGMTIDEVGVQCLHLHAVHFYMFTRIYDWLWV